MCTLALLSPSPSQPEAGVMKLVPLLLQPTPLIPLHIREWLVRLLHPSAEHF